MQPISRSVCRSFDSSSPHLLQGAAAGGVSRVLFLASVVDLICRLIALSFARRQYFVAI